MCIRHRMSITPQVLVITIIRGLPRIAIMIGVGAITIDLTVGTITTLIMSGITDRTLDGITIGIIGIIIGTASSIKLRV